MLKPIRGDSRTNRSRLGHQARQTLDRFVEEVGLAGVLRELILPVRERLAAARDADDRSRWYAIDVSLSDCQCAVHDAQVAYERKVAENQAKED